MLITISLNQAMKAYKESGLQLKDFAVQYILANVYDEYLQTNSADNYAKAIGIVQECYPLVTGDDFHNAYCNF